MNAPNRTLKSYDLSFLSYRSVLKFFNLISIYCSCEEDSRHVYELMRKGGCLKYATIY